MKNKSTLIFFISLTLLFPSCEKSNLENIIIAEFQNDNQIGIIESPLPNPIKVLITDYYNTPILNKLVVFKIIRGGGNLSASNARTNSDGYAETIWTLGNTTGEHFLEASIEHFEEKKVYTFKANAYEGITDSRDGKSYPILTIGSQTWMIENLQYDVPSIYTSGSIKDTFNRMNPSQYGRYYDWHTIMNSANPSNTIPSGVQGICPSGWHLPSDAEWSILQNFVPDRYDLKSITGWNFNGTNNSGFNAYPTGSYSNISFQFGGRSAYFWSATESSSSQGIARILGTFIDGDLGERISSKSNGYPCRCLKN